MRWKTNWTGFEAIPCFFFVCDFVVAIAIAIATIDFGETNCKQVTDVNVL